MGENESFLKLVEIFKQLRDPKTGCPWDIKQTHESLVEHLLEESHELVDAIKHDQTKLKEELGDLLLQVMLHSQIASDNDNFDIYDVIETLSNKLIERHPHVFGEQKINSAEAVKQNWENIKKKKSKTLLAGLPRSAPALMKSELIGKKVAVVGFDWENPEQIKEKITEELEELYKAKSPKEIEEELGDLLFTIAQYGRKVEAPAELALEKACNKFIKRFNWMENNAGENLDNLTLDQLEKLWQKAKTKDL